MRCTSTEVSTVTISVRINFLRVFTVSYRSITLYNLNDNYRTPVLPDLTLPRTSLLQFSLVFHSNITYSPCAVNFHGRKVYHCTLVICRGTVSVRRYF